MTQPTERRFVMEPRLDAEVEAINDALDTKVDLTDPRLTDERTPLNNSVTSAKIANGAIVDEDINASAAIKPTKIEGTAVTRADTGTVTSTMIANGTIVNADIANTTIESEKLAAQDYIKFDTTYTGGSTQPGELAWDPDNETLQFQLDPHVTLQIGQEHVMRVKNNSGSVAIPNGTVVMFAGAAGDTIKVSPAVSDGTINVNYLAGITTEQIPADGFGFITQLGFVNGVNTNAYPVGTLLYSNPAVPGGLTATEPEAPAWTMPVAAVTKQNSSSGRLLVRAIPGGSGAGGGASVNVSDTAPVGGNEGDLWLDSTDGTLYVYYEDVDGAQWIQVQANSALGASIESRLGALESQAIAYGNQNPNMIINGAFDIWQRGTSLSHSGGGVGSDAWRQYTDSGSGTQTRDTTNYPAGLPAQSYRFTATANSTNWSLFQILETANCINFAGRVVTFSVYLMSSSVRTFRLSFGTNVNTDAAWTNGSWVTNSTQDVNVTSSWQRFTFTLTVPSNARTIQFGVSSNGANMSSGSWVNVAGVQLEAGSVATSFRRNGNGIQEELANCQRYFQRYGGSPTNITICHGTVSTGTNAVTYLPLIVEMRSAPTFSRGPLASFRQHVPGVVISTPTLVGLSISSSKLIQIDSTAGSGFTPGHNVKLESAGADGIIDLSAEL